MFFKDIQTYAPIAIDVWMEDFRPKCNLKKKKLDKPPFFLNRLKMTNGSIESQKIDNTGNI